MDKSTDENVLRWSGCFERIERNRIAKGVHMGEESVGRPRKR